jgi:hypothetical protein
LSARLDSIWEQHRPRLAAVAPQLGIQSVLWGGLFEVKPGARTAIHHHGQQQTIAYVLSGISEWGVQGEYAARSKAGDFIHVPAFAAHGDQFVGFGAFPLGRREEHLDADRGEPSGRYLAAGGGGPGALRLAPGASCSRRDAKSWNSPLISLKYSRRTAGRFLTSPAPLITARQRKVPQRRANAIGNLDLGK